MDCCGFCIVCHHIGMVVRRVCMEPETVVMVGCRVGVGHGNVVRICRRGGEVRRSFGMWLRDDGGELRGKWKENICRVHGFYINLAVI